MYVMSICVNLAHLLLTRPTSLTTAPPHIFTISTARLPTHEHVICPIILDLTSLQRPTLDRPPARPFPPAYIPACKTAPTASIASSTPPSTSTSISPPPSPPPPPALISLITRGICRIPVVHTCCCSGVSPSGMAGVAGGGSGPGSMVATGSRVVVVGS